MPRRTRVLLPGVTMHLIQRGNNRSACFYAEEDYLYYLTHLAEQARKHGCVIHAWCLMINHVHLLVTPAEPGSVGALMKGLGQRYVQYINRTYRRTGTLWEGRYRSCLLQTECYVLACYRYIELNPVRARMVEHPAEYRWSSYRVNAQAESSDLITLHPVYKALSDDPVQRTEIYRALFRSRLDPGLVEQIRGATNGNFLLGSPCFAAEIEHALGRRVTRGKPGRPRTVPSNPDLLL